MRFRTGLMAAAALAAAVAFATTGEAKTFRYATTGDILGLDPHINNEGPTNTMKGNIYGSLLHRKADLSLEPDLATEWKAVDDTHWRFKLRQGVKFSNGDPFTADDVIFSFKRQTQEASDMAFALSSVKDIKKISDYEIEIETKGPDPILLLNMPNFFIVDKKFMEENNAVEVVKGAGKTNWANLHANGTGPFMVKEWVQDNRLVLERNPNYWGKDKLETNVTEAIFTPIPNDATRVAALLSGEIDMMYPVPLQDVQRLESDPNVKVQQGPELRTIFLGMDQWRKESLDMPGSGKNPFLDVRVREAFAHAIDLKAIHRVVMRGASTPTGEMIAPGINGFQEDLNTPYKYDPALSKKLLKEAGYEKGFPVTFDCPNDRYVNDEAICTAIVPMLERIGIKVTLNAQTKSLHFNKIGSASGNNTSFYMLGWTPGSYDAYNVLQNIMTMDGAGQGAWNCGRYSNPKVEQLTDQIAVTVDEKKRNEMIHEAFKIHKDDVGHIPLHQQALAWGYRSDKVAKIIQRPFNDVDLRYVTMK
ncbi:peptide/nickel transport system substrate-binding protein [Tistlia consotensis]|uniref:Peptide/nickel transport system substrate-binding protein n=1 Tax=Tistlia consotensis USBA 355 TaxID=560819 RepID=A0A1Y6B7M8_9PROT|nr:ABC transporter substrate-binding protein [Tistlia consotensis]SME88600.1 peptide/nickel transport system substrate-binding protein [Tistlia consotensis USBA 355]SNR25114.1 peptide/nickel transport system substrate-binding protein [Tistlia consotensis]